MKEGVKKLDDNNMNIIKTPEQMIDEFCLFDDTFMSLVFENNLEATQLLLNIILERDDMIVTEAVGQREMKNPDPNGRNVRLDIFAKDSSGKNYDVEVQRSSGGANVKRARYNSSAMDVRMLKSRQDFSEMKETYIIFITEKDVMSAGLPLYHAERVIMETGELFDDGSHIIYVNGAYEDLTTPIGKLVHDFKCTKASDMMYNIIAKQVSHYKETEGGRKEMCKLVEDYAEQRRLDALFEAVKGIMESFKVSLEKAMDVAKISDADKAILEKRF